ncbi:MAG: TlpA family protein disulfide reductase [Chloroflexi bacterium]|nr:TlpA family protein disulfide reductase [Chloroflexota bacterium]
MQKTQRIILYVLLLITGAAWILLSAETTTTSESTAPQVGFLAPDFTLNTMDGQVYTLSKLRGNAVLINLWATWCPPCRAEMPAIEKVYQEYKDQGFIVLAVNAANQDDIAAVTPFLDQYSLTFPVVLDVSGDASAKYQLQSLPSSYFIDRQGIIREVIIGGPMSETLLRTRVEQILK